MRVDPPGFEPGASALQGQRSPSLSYGPITKEDKKIALTLTNESGSVDDYSVWLPWKTSKKRYISHQKRQINTKIMYII